MAESESVVTEFPTEDALKFLEGTAPFIMNQGFAPHVYSNDPYNPIPYGLLDVLYRNTFENRLGIMVGKDNTTGESTLVLCFVGDKGDDDVDLFPIATLLKEDELTRYSAPTGDGTFYEHTDAATE